MLTISPITYAAYVSFFIVSFNAFMHLPAITISYA